MNNDGEEGRMPRQWEDKTIGACSFQTTFLVLSHYSDTHFPLDAYAEDPRFSLIPLPQIPLAVPLRSPCFIP
jgi:hypothetical protein